jgi:hypothetical protein
MLEVRVPVVPFPDPIVQKQQPLPRSLDGIVLGVLDNQKPNASLLLDRIIARLGERSRLAKLVRTQKSPPIPASEEAITTLSGGADMTLIASAD